MFFSSTWDRCTDEKFAKICLWERKDKLRGKVEDKSQKVGDFKIKNKVKTMCYNELHRACTGEHKIPSMQASRPTTNLSGSV